MALAAAVVIGLIAYLVWKLGPRRRAEPGFKYVYVNQDGSVREVSPGEQAYLSEDFPGWDSSRPYIKTSYESSDGWGSQSGFIERRRVPSRLPILPVNPNYDAAEKALEKERSDPYRADADLFVQNADGSVGPNPAIRRKERFQRIRSHQLAQQRRREELAKVQP